jgi:hypothetical protein
MLCFMIYYNVYLTLYAEMCIKPPQITYRLYDYDLDGDDYLGTLTSKIMHSMI